MYVDYIRSICKDKKVCIFPMGIAGKSLCDKLSTINIQVDYFCDNDSSKIGTEYKGVKCISKTELKAFGNECIILVESLYYKEIKASLCDEGYTNVFRIYYEKIAGEDYIKNNQEEFAELTKRVKSILGDEKSLRVFNRIIDAYITDDLSDDYFDVIYDKDQYFDKELIHFSDNEVFVDLGAYIGDSAEHFIEKCSGYYEKIHLFELDPDIYKRLMLNIPHLYEKTVSGIIQAYPYGASDNSCKVSFQSGDSSSKIIKKDDDDNLVTASVKPLDALLFDEKVTFIKSDIEGAEMSALRGARKTIEKQRPVLAFCIYHSIQDTLNIPLWIKETFPGYKVYIRHYTDMLLETVCYAIPEMGK